MPRRGGLVLLAALVTACGAREPETLAAGHDELNDRIGEGAQLAAACAGCHSQVSAPSFVDLAQYDENTLRARLTDYRLDIDGTSVMHRLARGYTEADIALVSAYISVQNEAAKP